MKVTILGCGSSAGVPLVGCSCDVCTSDTPKNKRSRVSVFIEFNGKNLLIDTSPDLRQQALDNDIKRVDAILYTHDHADHTHGIDDLRSFNHLKGDSLPIYCNKTTYNSLLKRFEYAFKEKPDIWYRPSLRANILDEGAIQHLNVEGVEITAFEQTHGKTITLGFRIGNFAYSTDVNALPDTAFDTLKSLDVWVVDCLRHTTSPTHANLEMTLNWLERVRPKRAILTHMGHEMDYDSLINLLPNGVEPAYDGMEIHL